MTDTRTRGHGPGQQGKEYAAALEASKPRPGLGRFYAAQVEYARGTIEERNATEQDTGSMSKQAPNALAQSLEYTATRSLGDTRTGSRAASMASLSLRDMLPSLVDNETGRVRRLPPENLPAGERYSLSAALLASARTLQAGAQLIVLPDPMMIDTGFAPITQHLPSGLIAIDAAEFAATDPDEEVGETALPIAEAMIDREAGTQYGLRVKISRRQVKSKGWDTVANELMTSIVSGLARAVDRELLKAIAATTPPAFSLPAAAAAGCRFSELRALVGTDGTAATVNATGDLNAAGVPAELTPVTAGTYVADWTRTGVAVNDEISLILHRLDVTGTLEVTAFIDLHALLPDAGKVWAAA